MSVVIGLIIVCCVGVFLVACFGSRVSDKEKESATLEELLLRPQKLSDEYEARS